MKILLLHGEIVFGYFELRTSTHVEAGSCIEAAYNLVAEVTAANYPTFQSKYFKAPNSDNSHQRSN